MRVLATVSDPITDLTFADGGRTLVLRTGAGRSCFTGIDAKTGESVWQRTFRQTAVIAPGGQFIAVPTDFGTETIVRTIANWSEVARFNHEPSPEYHFAFTPDGREIAGIAARDSSVWRWAIPPGYPLHQLAAHGEPLRVCYSPGGKWLIALTRPPKIRVWERPGMRLATDIELPRVPIRSVWFAASPDDDTLALILEKPVLLSISHRREPLTLRGSRGFVFAAVFSREGRRLLTGTNDGIRVWDVATGSDCGGYDFQFGAAVALALAPDGLTCAAGGENGQVVVWDVDT